MQIEHSRIAIRERTWSDNLDLALQVIRTNPKALLVASLVGVLPMIVVNYAIIDAYYGDRLSEGADVDAMTLGTLLVMIEAPLGTAPVTLYLGQALFVERPSANRSRAISPRACRKCCCFKFCSARAGRARAHLDHSLCDLALSERSHFAWTQSAHFARRATFDHEAQLAVAPRRQRRLPGPGHRLGLAGPAARRRPVDVLSDSARFAVWDLQQGWTGQILSFQCVLWLVAVYFTVARFLTYLDQRIRNEGWEVELALRAQRDRLLRHAA